MWLSWKIIARIYKKLSFFLLKTSFVLLLILIGSKDSVVIAQEQQPNKLNTTPELKAEVPQEKPNSIANIEMQKSANTWGKEILNVKPPAEPNDDISDKMKELGSNYMKQLTKYQSGKNKKLIDIQKKWTPTSDKQFLFYVATMRDVPEDQKGNTAEVSHSVTKDSAFLATEFVKKQMDIYQQYYAGYSFDINLSPTKLFSSTPSPQEKSASQKSASNLRKLKRYGLKLKGISPTNKKMIGYAAVNSNLEEQLAMSEGATNVDWTIGPIEHQVDPINVGFDENTGSPAVIKEPSLYDQAYSAIPELAFTGSLKPNKKMEDDKVNPNPPPSNTQKLAVDVGLEQKQGYYSYTKTLGIDSNNGLHSFKLPIRGAVFAWRYADDSFHLNETQMTNILAPFEIPVKVNITHNHVKSLYNFQVVKSLDKGAILTFSALPPAGFQVQDLKKGYRGKCELNFTKPI